jgi:CRP-like cAMP-binding protein
MQNPFFADRTLAEALQAQSASRFFGRGSILFIQGQSPVGIFIIRRGRASLLMRADNGVEIAHFPVGAGSILGLPAVVARQPYTLSAMADEPLEVSCVSLEDYERLIHEQPSLYPSVLDVLAAEVRSARTALTDCWKSWESDPRPASYVTQ